MGVFFKFGNVFHTVEPRRLETLNPVVVVLSRYCHFESKLGINSSAQSSSLTPGIDRKNVAIFWDLDNKPPNPFPPYEAALKLKKTASSFGYVRHMIAYANRHAFSYVPPAVREQRKERKMLNQLENRGLIKPPEPYLCRVCGRNFYNHDKLVNHFKQIHERENTKRMNQIESARGSKRVKMVAKYSMKMEKYKKAARDILTPKVGYGLANDLKRAGFWVREVSNKPQAADIAMKNHIVDIMDHRRAECLVLVSDDSDFASVLQEAKLRCLKTVVVGNINDGALKRVADTGFSWKEIMMGKAQKEAISVLGKWKDSDVLKRLEWKYDPEVEKSVYDTDDESEDENVKNSFEGEEDDEGDDDGFPVEDGCPWWDLESDYEATVSQPRS
ncbi:hypothetical protein UlMin_019720 [Ulmus minor]